MSNSVLILIRTALKTMIESKKFDRVLDKVQVISASKGELTAEMVITEESVNSSNRLHGGMTATLVDQLSSLALKTTLNCDQTVDNFVKVQAVSVHLSIDYLNAVQKGETILICANTLKCGRSMAFLEVLISNKETNQLVAKGNHIKYILN